MPQRLPSYPREGCRFMSGVEHVFPRSVTSVTAIVDRDRAIDISGPPLKFRGAAVQYHGGPLGGRRSTASGCVKLLVDDIGQGAETAGRAHFRSDPSAGFAVAGLAKGL
jgi:hypothetical protein